MNDHIVTQIQERLRNVYSIVTNELADSQQNAATIEAINRINERGPVEEKKSNTNTTHKQRLRTLYTGALLEAESEEQIIRKALDRIYEIRTLINDRRIQVKHSGNKETIRRGALMKALQMSAQTLPLWIGKPGEKTPPLCGAVAADSSYVAKVGDMVAALQRSEGDDNWILAEVIHYNVSTGRYELDDIDEEQKERISLSRKRVIPLPLMRANPETDPDSLFKTNSIVMALYPQTTCFYKAIISSPPVTHNDEYEVLFEDQTYPDGYSPALKVAQRYVIPHRDKKSK